jgi:hypothetical protein
MSFIFVLGEHSLLPTHSPPEALLAALKEEDFGLSEFVWLDKKDKSESDNSHERNQKSSEGDEARARRIAEIRRRVEEEVARRRKEMAQQEEEAEKKAKRKNLADNALVLQCAHCSAPITKGMFTHIPVIAHSRIPGNQSGVTSFGLNTEHSSNANDNLSTARCQRDRGHGSQR